MRIIVIMRENIMDYGSKLHSIKMKVPEVPAELAGPTK